MQFILFSRKQPRLDRFVGRSQGSEAVTLAGSGGPYGSLIFKVQKASGVKTHCWATISRFKWEVEYTCWIFQQAKFDCQRYVQATNDLKSRQTSGSIPVIPMTTSISVIISSGFIRFQSHIFGKNQWINGKIPELRTHEEYLALITLVCPISSRHQTPHWEKLTRCASQWLVHMPHIRLGLKPYQTNIFEGCYPDHITLTLGHPSIYLIWTEDLNLWFTSVFCIPQRYNIRRHGSRMFPVPHSRPLTAWACDLQRVICAMVRTWYMDGSGSSGHPPHSMGT